MISNILESAKDMNLNFTELLTLLILAGVAMAGKYLIDIIVKTINANNDKKYETEERRIENYKQQKIQEKIAREVEQLTLMKELVKKIDNTIRKLDNIEKSLIRKNRRNQ